jgi:hypothetical protein
MLIEQYFVAAKDEDRAADLLDHDGNRALRLSRGQRDYPVRTTRLRNPSSRFIVTLSTPSHL